jgi:hypothetical protein
VVTICRSTGGKAAKDRDAVVKYPYFTQSTPQVWHNVVKKSLILSVMPPPRFMTSSSKLRHDVQQTSARNSKLLEICERTQLSVRQAASPLQPQIATRSDNIIDRINGLEKSPRDNIASHHSDQTMNVAKYIADAQARFDIRVD